MTSNRHFMKSRKRGIMNTDTLLHYLDLYGYAIIFLFLFLGIVGIPAPEESLLFLIGVLIFQHSLSFVPATLSAFFGAFIGMLSAYVVGRYIGSPFIRKYGKYVGITEERWDKVQEKYMKNVRKTILLGYYMPGIRQISPYFAGINRIGFGSFFFLSLVGALIWTLPFILAGLFVGSKVDINPAYVPYLGLVFLAIFFLFVLINYVKKKKGKRMNSPQE